MIKVKRLRHVSFASPNVEAQLDYYQSIIGLAVIGRDDRRIILGTESDELTLVLEHGAASRLTAIAYEVAPGLDLSDLQKSLASLNIKSEVRSDTAPGIPKTLVFNDPTGFRSSCSPGGISASRSNPSAVWPSPSSVTSRSLRPTRNGPRNSSEAFSASVSPTGSRKISSSCVAAPNITR